MKRLFAMVLVGLVGCAQVPAAAPDGGRTSSAAAAADVDTVQVRGSVERLTLSIANQTVIDARIDGLRMHGVEHEIAHFDDGYRGKSPRGFLFLSERQPGLISGVRGSEITTFSVNASTGRVHARGRWGGKEFGVALSKDAISVSRRFCTDVYRRADKESDVFVGEMDCWNAGRSGVHLRVPDAFFERPASEQVVFLAAFLM